MILMTCWQLCSFIYNNKSSDLMLGLIRETVRAEHKNPSFTRSKIKDN